MAIPSDSITNLPDDEQRQIQHVSVTAYGSTAPNGGWHLPSDERSRSWVEAQVLPPDDHRQTMPRRDSDGDRSYMVYVTTDLSSDSGEGSRRSYLDVDRDGGWMLHPYDDDMGPYEMGGAATEAEAFCHGVLAAVAMAGRERRESDADRAAELATWRERERQPRSTYTLDECPLCPPLDLESPFSKDAPGVPYLNFGRDTYAGCKTHRVYWPTNAWLASCWRFETREEWIENAALLETYELVEPRVRVRERERAIA